MAHVLVADDNALSLEFFKEALAAGRHTCEVARDGESTVQLAVSQHFDLMLIDARMPGQSGAQALRTIRDGNGACRETPALATTADASADRALLLDAGFAEVLIKPISVSALQASIAGHLQTRGSASPGMLLLDDAIARETTGGDPAIVAALRSLLALELDLLPEEMGRYARARDFPALHDRLHRLDASAGFCGTPLLIQAARNLRRQLDLDEGWPDGEIDALLGVARQTRDALG